MRQGKTYGWRPKELIKPLLSFFFVRVKKEFEKKVVKRGGGGLKRGVF